MCPCLNVWVLLWSVSWFFYYHDYNGHGQTSDTWRPWKVLHVEKQLRKISIFYCKYHFLCLKIRKACSNRNEAFGSPFCCQSCPSAGSGPLLRHNQLFGNPEHALTQLARFSRSTRDRLCNTHLQHKISASTHLFFIWYILKVVNFFQRVIQ